jgi:hypothetical protein
MAVQNIPLPIPPMEYDQQLEAQFRRQVEIGFQQTNSTITANKTQSNKDASLALRRHQFLLMGAS